MSDNTALATLREKKVSYTPFGESEPLELTVGMIGSFIATPTRSGQKPSAADQIKFLMLCKARQLNPWAGDAYLCGYDSKDGPSFSLITAHQALLKRAEACPAYDGMESGIIVRNQGEVIERPGAMRHEGDELIGGWAIVHRKDRQFPQAARVEFAVYNTNRSRWSKDPAGMIAKVAEAHGLRKAFPTQLGGLYCAEEMDHTAGVSDRPAGRQSLTRSSLEDEIEGEIVEPAEEDSAEPESPALMDEPPADWEPSGEPAFQSDDIENVF